MYEKPENIIIDWIEEEGKVLGENFLKVDTLDNRHRKIGLMYFVVIRSHSGKYRRRPKDIIISVMLSFF